MHGFPRLLFTTAGERFLNTSAYAGAKAAQPGLVIERAATPREFSSISFRFEILLDGVIAGGVRLRPHEDAEAASPRRHS